MAPKIAWSFEPGVLLGVGLLLWLYVTGWRRARGSGGERGRGALEDGGGRGALEEGGAHGRGARREPHPPGYGRLTLFCCGLLVILVALVSPVDELAQQLLLMHMLQHILLLDVAPILLIVGLTKVLLRPVTRRLQVIERRLGWLAHPAVAVVVYVGFMWLWHVPALYDAALRYPNLHALEHFCFAAAGGLYWWHLLSPIRSRMRLGGLAPIGYMVSTKLLVGLLGVGLAFAPNAIYPFYEHHPHYWGLTADQDQSIAGLLMALEQSIVMGVALVVLFVQMLGESEREAQRAERYEVA